MRVCKHMTEDPVIGLRLGRVEGEVTRSRGRMSNVMSGQR